MNAQQQRRWDVVSSTLGLVSAAIAIAALTVMIMLVPDSRHPEYDPIRLAARYCAFVASPVLAIPALALGIVGIRREGTDAFYSILGAVFSAIAFICVISVVVIVVYD